MDPDQQPEPDGVPGSLVALMVVCAIVGVSAIAWCFFTTCVGRDALLWLRDWLRRRRAARAQGPGWTPLPQHQQD
ncbi:hypothetical protein H4R18_002895 [Coemansia javaensis]|uniref:Uncharacterized protein n=1 Tax=Coemansia javaensis TaxID=2761396 RepID=A0A9W8HAT2_9FUNG|nr:hypothetical protein H4R18_002895 [Coemansia javaensis]